MPLANPAALAGEGRKDEVYGKDCGRNVALSFLAAGGVCKS